MRDGDRISVRAFVAVAVNETVRDDLKKAQARLGRSLAPVSWVPPENIHLSLLFLGSLARDGVAAVGEALRDASTGVEPFQIEVVGLGTFGRPGFPRVIWAGVRPSAPLMRLQERVTVAVGALGLKVEDREYRPHVTLGRVRSPSDGGRLMEILEEMKGREFGSVNVDDVSLMESVLKPHRSEYSVLCSVHLAPGSR